MTPNGCNFCLMRPNLCHGDVGLGLGGCISFNHKICEDHKWTCLCNPSRLFHRNREAGGFECNLKGDLRPVVDPLPLYIPTFYHGFPCAHPLDLEWVAIPLYAIFARRSDGKFRAAVSDGGELRKSLSLKSRTKIIITGPGYDQPIENFWRHHQKERLLECLTGLGVQAFTVPNYSFFSDAPPLHNRYNRSRILRVAERASAAGLSTVLHLNALHEQDWRDWETLLRDHPEIVHVCLEWQTGYACRSEGDKAFSRLVALQTNIGRPLHPIFVGGGRYAEELCAHFRSKTVIDADPFMNTLHRKVFSEKAGGVTEWKFRRSARNEPLDTRFRFNYEKHARRITDRLMGRKPPVQTEFGFTVTPRTDAVRPAQVSLSDFRLPANDGGEPADIPAAQPSENFALPNRSRVCGQIASAIVPPPARPELGASLANSRHRNNRGTRQPNGSVKASKEDAQGGC